MQALERRPCLFTAMFALVLTAGCAARQPAPAPDPVIDESDAGEIIGGVAGAAIGSQVGDGTGQTIATIAGALIGSQVGERIGARAERRDLERAATALERNRLNETSTWENPRTGNDFAVTPVNRFERAERECREFRFRVETAYGEDTRMRTACRQPDGTWEIVS